MNFVCQVQSTNLIKIFRNPFPFFASPPFTLSFTLIHPHSPSFTLSFTLDGHPHSPSASPSMATLSGAARMSLREFASLEPDFVPYRGISLKFTSFISPNPRISITCVRNPALDCYMCAESRPGLCPVSLLNISQKCSMEQ